MNKKLFIILKYLLGWPFSILAFLFILKLIAPQVSTLTTNINHLRIDLFIYGITCFLFFYFLRSYIWHQLLKTYSTEISFKQTAYFWAISELKRYIPGNLWSFLGRAVVFSELKISKKNTARLLVVEAVLFVLGAGIVSLLSFPFIISYFFPRLSSYFQQFILLIISLLLLTFIFRNKIKLILSDFGLSNKCLLLLLSICSVLLFGLGNYFTISSFINLPLNLVFQLSGFFALSFLIGYLSIITPAGFGVREGIVISGLSKLITVSHSAFAALFSRIILIFSELIFVLLSYLFYKIKNKRFLDFEKWIANHKYETILFLLFLIYVLYFSIASFLRYDNFYAGRFDLGNMAQTVWNTTRGRIFVFTNPNGTDVISRLGFHADFLLILLAPFYKIIPNPKTLLFIQALVVAAGCFFVYQIAKNILKDKNLALAFAFSYLINPSIQRATLYDFHSVTLATTFLLGVYYFYSKKKYIYFSIFAVLSAICKEQLWLIIALFGGLIFLRQKKKLFGGAISIFSLGIFYYLVAIAIPHSRGSGHFALAYYSEFGDGPLTIIKTIILSPQKTLNILLRGDRINYLVQLFAPVGFLSILFPFYLIFAIPDLLINLLSNNTQLHQIYYDYTSAISPFIFISAIWGAFVIRKFVSRVSLLMITILLLFSGLTSAYLYGPLPGSKQPNIDMFTKPVANRERIVKYVSKIPRRFSVAASNNVGSHLSQRQRIYTLPLGIDKADIIVFLLNGTESAQSIKAEIEQLKKIKTNKNYKMVINENPFFVFRKRVYN